MERSYYLEGEKYDWVIAPKGFEKIFHSQRARELRRFIGPLHSITLDAGSGTGLITRYLSGIVIACDLNLWNLERAKTRVIADFVQCDLSALPFRTIFDNIVSSEVLEHISQPEKAVREFRRVLKPRGRFIGSVPSQSSIWKFRSLLSRTHPHSEPFHNNFSRSKLRSLLLTSFKKVRIISAVLGMAWFFEAQN